ncbi:MAG: PKD domain-containing protein [Thermoplasmata archaeon]|nr:MAG: PKD domain-containing protein [Thermoplasmata archaeon]
MKKTATMIIVLLLCIGFFGTFGVSPGASSEDFTPTNHSRATPTNISGLINTDTTWTAANSPYHIIDNTTLYEGNTLTIETGTVVKFAHQVTFTIRGKLKINGDSTNRVIFTNLDPNKSYSTKFNVRLINYWYNGTGIDYNFYIDKEKGASVSISYAKFEYSSGNLFYFNLGSSGTNDIISNCIFKNNHRAFDGHVGDWAPPVIIKNSDFINNGVCIGRANYIVYDSYFQNNSVGLFNADRVNVYGSKFIENQVGISVEHDCETKYNEFYNNNIAVEWGNGHDQYTLKQNSIFDNRIGVYFSEESSAKVHYNNIFNNTDYNMKNRGIRNRYASNNWWGTTNTAVIDQYIHDIYDDVQLGEVLYKPFLSSPVPITNQPPVADTGPDKNASIFEWITFDGSGSYDPHEDILSYYWDFGDGISGNFSESVMHHSYNATGIYNVTLTVSDGWLTDSDTCIVNVSVKLIFHKPPDLVINEDEHPDNIIDLWDYVNSEYLDMNKLNFTIINNTNPKCGATIDSDRFIDIIPTLNWYGESVVTIRGKYGYSTAVQNLKITVKPVNDAPIADAGVDQNVIVNKTVNFNGSGSYDIEGDPLTYEWDFGDGSPSFKTNSSSSAQHIYKAPGNYTVILKVSDGHTEVKDTCQIIAQITSKPGKPHPTFSTEPPMEVTEGIQWSYSPEINYEGSGNVTYNLVSGPEGMEIESGLLTWTPSDEQAGSHNVRIKATVDGITVYQEFNLSVAKGPGDGTPPRIVSTTPEDGSTLVPIKTKEIIIRFSEPMDSSSVESALSIAPGIKYSIQWVVGTHNTVLMIKLNEDLSGDTAYSIKLDSSAMDMEGENLEASFTLQFTSEPGSQTEDEDGSRDLFGNSNLFPFLLILIIAFIIVIATAIVLRSRRKKAGGTDWAPTEYEGRVDADMMTADDGVTANNMGDRFSDQTIDPSEGFISDLKEEALRLEKPSDFDMTQEEMLNKIRTKFEKGEISKEAYDSIVVTLNVKK